MSRGISPTLQTVRGAPSWRIASDCVEAFVTRDGGHLAPVTFQTARGPVQPFAVAPWSGESLARETPPVLRALRGDFFCLPFGANVTPWRGESHSVHGETAGARWKGARLQASGEGVEFAAELHPTIRPGRVVKRLQLRAGETNLYCRHELSGFTGPMPIGHHATLQFPEGSSAAVSLSPWREGRVCPLPFEDPAQGGYFTLKPGAPFTRLGHVPLAQGGWADLANYPAREGFEDLVMVSSRKSAGLAWSAVTVSGNPGYVWFALKEPRVLASTILWHSNGGRHYAPWLGRHRRVLGVEDVTSYFHYGLDESARRNSLNARGVPTALRLRPTETTRVNYIMGIATPGPKFDRVRSIQFEGDEIILIAHSGVKHRHPVDLTFFDPR